MFLRGKPRGGIGAGGLADEVVFVGIVIGGLYEFCCNAASFYRLRDESMLDDERVSTEEIGYKGVVTFYGDSKTMLVVLVSDIEIHGCYVLSLCWQDIKTSARNVNVRALQRD